jgi:hypothetical protein
MAAYPVTFEMDYVERRSRLTTFFRWLLVIPHLVVLWLWSIAAGVVVVIAWFALVFTARYPQGMYDFVAGFLRYASRVYGYAQLGVDPYPPFSGGEEPDYPVRLNIGEPLERYSRLKAGFRFILAIPIAIVVYAMQIVYGIGSFIAWFAIVILGRQPRGLQDMINLGVSYQQRASAYFALITEDWPPFTDDRTREVEPAAAFGALPESGPPAAAATTVQAAGEPAPLGEQAAPAAEEPAAAEAAADAAPAETAEEPPPSAEEPPPSADEPGPRADEPGPRADEPGPRADEPGPPASESTPQDEPPRPHGDPLSDEDEDLPPTTRI